jgi:hypothetical protein
VHIPTNGEDMHKVLLTTAAAVAMLSTAALAQQPVPAAKGPQNNAINSSDKPQPAQPVAGRNSFTEGEAQSRIEAKGFTNVTDLQKDGNGVWQGHAMKGGQQVSVSLDYQGNVVAK